MEIRFLDEKDDLFVISNIYESSWKHAYKNIMPQEYLDSIPAGRWAGTITKGGKISLVVTENEQIIGTASICRSRWDKFKEYGEIVSIYFLPEYIRKGFGRHLLKRCVDELNKMGFDKILLWVLEENIPARKFYEKNGFIFSDEYMDDNIGGKDLREVMYYYER